MPVFISRTAANTLYVGFIYVYFVVALLGVLEQVVYPLELLPIIPLSSAALALLLGFVLLALKPVPFSRTTKPLGYFMVVVGFMLLAHFQLNIWGAPNTRWPWVSENGFTTSLNALLVLSFMCGLTIKLFNVNASGHAGRLTRRVMFVIILLGFALWHLSGMKAVEREVANAKSKVHLIETMVNRNITEYSQALGRIKTRLENVAEDDFYSLVDIDFSHYTTDYDIIEGMVLLNAELQPLKTNAFAETFIQSGVLDKEGVQRWLRR